jgi:hypothetical protein
MGRGWVQPTGAGPLATLPGIHDAQRGAILIREAAPSSVTSRQGQNGICEHFAGLKLSELQWPFAGKRWWVVIV